MVGTAGFAESSLQNVVFVNNSANNYGGAVVVDGQDAFLFLRGNATFRSCPRSKTLLTPAQEQSGKGRRRYCI